MMPMDDMTSMTSTMTMPDPSMPHPELPATLTKAAVLLYMAGAFLLCAGFLIKFAATWSGGLDIYYYKVSLATCTQFFPHRFVHTGYVSWS
jgi:hypothetical protein